jgi:hypothetical protein
VQQPDGSLEPFVVPGRVSNWTGNHTLTRRSSRNSTAALSLGYGGTPIYAEASDGKQLRSASLQVRPTQSVRIEGAWRPRTSRGPRRFEYAQSTIPRLKVDASPAARSSSASSRCRFERSA